MSVVQYKPETDLVTTKCGPRSPFSLYGYINLLHNIEKTEQGAHIGATINSLVRYIGN